MSNFKNYKMENHQEKQRIFDEYAKEKWSLSFNDFLVGTINEVLGEVLSTNEAVKEIKEIVFAACDLVQAEQQKRIAKNQRKIFYKFYEDGNTASPVFIVQANTSDQAYKLAYDHHGPQVEGWLYQMMTDEEQIFNPENKIQ